MGGKIGLSDPLAMNSNRMLAQKTWCMNNVRYRKPKCERLPNMENEEYGKRVVWKIRSVEKVASFILGRQTLK